MHTTDGNPLGLDIAEMDPALLIPLHEIDRPEDLAALTASMRADGWHGAPLVISRDLGAGGWLVTGNHRREAAIAAGITVPCVDVSGLFEAAGIELADEGALFGTEREAVLYELPASIRDTYGIDV